jgi:hypothetical protein
MELVTALFATVAGAAETVLPEAALSGAVSGAEGVGAASAASAASGTASAWQGLQGVLTAGQLLSQAGAGVAAIAQGNVNATNADLTAKEQALRIQSDYLKKVGSARVAFAGAGLTLGNGSETGVEQSLANQEQFETNLALASGKAKAQASEMQGYSGAISAVGGIAKTGADYAISIAKRGLPS